MLLEISAYSRLLHILLFSSALPTGKALTLIEDWKFSGILISGLIATNINSPKLLIALEAFGSGAIFYVASFEMLPENLRDNNFKITKYCLSLAGVAIIAILQIFHSDE